MQLLRNPVATLKKRITPDLIPTELRVVMTKLPSPIMAVLSFVRLPLHALSREDFTPEFSGKRFVIKKGIRNFTIFDGYFVRYDEVPGIKDVCDGYTEIVATGEKCEKLKVTYDTSSIVNAWDDKFIYLDLDKLFQSKIYRCYAV